MCAGHTRKGAHLLLNARDIIGGGGALPILSNDLHRDPLAGAAVPPHEHSLEAACPQRLPQLVRFAEVAVVARRGGRLLQGQPAGGACMLLLCCLSPHLRHRAMWHIASVLGCR